MKEHLTHILDQSVCLTRRQLRDYLSGAMLPVEAHAVEVHLASCPLCSMAMEGFEEHSEEALQAIAALNSGFLKEHFDNIAPQIHLNSMAPAMSAASASARKNFSFPVWRVTGIAAAVLLAVGIFWYVNERRNAPVLDGQHQVAMTNRQASPSAAVSLAASPVQSDAPPARAAAVKSAPMAASGVSASNNGPGTEDHSTAAKDRYDAQQPLGESSVAPLVSLATQFAPAQTSEEREMKKAADTLSNGLAALSDVNSPAIAGGRASGTKYVVDGTAADRKQDADKEEIRKAVPAPRPAAPASVSKAKAAAETDESDDAVPPSILEQGNKAFAAGKYNQALRFYQKQMKTGDAGDRQKAAIMAARCYAALGNNTKAQELLQNAASGDNGRQRRAARRELRKMK